MTHRTPKKKKKERNFINNEEIGRCLTFAQKQTYVTFCKPDVAAIEQEFTPATSQGFSGAVIFPPYYATINFLHINFIRFTTANKTEDE